MYVCGLLLVGVCLLLFFGVGMCVRAQLQYIDMVLQVWLKGQTLLEREATALAEEDYELAEQLRKQLETTEMRTEQEIAANCLIEVNKRIL